ncbi:MAG: helix-turn-helix domain-containing protein [Limisphaerales bacterium]|jgi:cytoskeletal protein RodZ
MPTVAEILRTTREGHRLSVHEVAEITKIKTEHIRALESGDYHVFAAPVYIRGFLRTYAKLLRLDPDELAAALDQELNTPTEQQTSNPAASKQKGILDELMLHVSKVNWRIVLPLVILTLVIVCSILGYRYWTSQEKRDPLSTLGSGQYNPQTNTTTDTLPLP